MPYSLRMLWRDRRRYLPALLAIGLSAVLIAVQCGLRHRPSASAKKGIPVVGNESGKDVTEQYRTRYRGVVAAEKRRGEVLVLIDEGETYAVSRHVLALTDTNREVVVRIFVDHVPKSRIEMVLSQFRKSAW